MFDEVNGLPAHVLMVHAAVVFVPLLALAAVVYALAPRLRARIGWVATLLAVVAPLSALFAVQSGEVFKERLVEQGMTGPPLAAIVDHQGYGDLTFWCSLALAVVTGALVYLTTRGARVRALPRAVDLGLAVVVVVLAGVTAYFVLQTGDTGASAVWGS